MLPLSFSYDHRVIDGAMGARIAKFLADTLAEAGGSGRGDVVSKIDLTVPDLGNFDEVAVIDVLVKVGDKIEVETPLVTLETDKATMDVPSTAAGTVTEVLVQKGGKIGKGGLIARIEGTAARPRPRSRPRAATPPPRLPRRPRPRRLRAAAPRAARAPRTAPEALEAAQARRAARSRNPVVGAGRGSRRLHRRVPRRRSRPQGHAGRALAHAGRRLPQRRLHSVQGAAARRQGHRRSR